MALHESELESEFEQEAHEMELESLHEGAQEHESEFLGSIGNMLGGLLGEGESELESESEFELESESELESEFEFEHEQGEAFLGGLGKLFKKALPILKSVARVAAPIVGTAIGGPFGTALGGVASSLLKEQEFESESEGEFEFESESESESEVAHEIAAHELTMHEALGEMMAEAAAQEASGGQAEGMVGAAVVTVLSPRDRKALRKLLPHLVAGACVLARILRRRRETRPFVRTVPTIMRRTVRSLKRDAAAGKPITRRTAARAASRQVRRVLANPRAAHAAMSRNMRASRAVGSSQRRHRAVAG